MLGLLKAPRGTSKAPDQDKPDAYERQLVTDANRTTTATIVIAIAAVFSFGASILQYVVLSGQLREMRTASAQTDKMVAAASAQERAWVGPYNAKLDSPRPPALNKDWSISIDYQNTGREPARKFTPSFDQFVGTPSDNIGGQVIAARIAGDVGQCKQMAPAGPSDVIFPISLGLGGGGYVQTVTIPMSEIDQAVIDGTKSVYVVGCFTYQTLEQIRHSSFCYFFTNSTSSVDHLNICNGADAD